MKITFVMPTPNNSGGMRTIAMYASCLRRRGHEVFLIAVPEPKPSLRAQCRSLLEGSGWISPTPVWTKHFDQQGLQCQVLEQTRPVVDADVPDADVVIATWWETAEWVAKLSPEKGAKAYYVQHHEIFDYLPKERVEASYQLPLHKITVANWLVELLKTRYNDHNISLVPPSVDTTQFYAPKRCKQAVPTVGLMYAGAPWKGVDIALEAISLATKHIPNLQLVAFGTGVEASPNLPLPLNAKFDPNPAQHQLKDFYAACDVWLFSSRYEAVGLPILEAMACRTPVIGTPAGIAPEMLTDQAGILVEPENPKDMARAIEQICRLSETEWQEMSDAAYRKTISYSWDDAAALFESALYRAIDSQAQTGKQLESSANR
jgi:glycosyltransferase involved in cell wall biosynthesis